MSFVGNILGDVIGGITGAKQAGKAAEQAGKIQAEGAEKGITEQRRQFDSMVSLMAPYVTAGTSAMGQQGAIIGLQGAAPQQQALDNISNSPIMQAMMQQGENAILQNASATGGLRGGNTQAALAQFRPQLLNSLIEQQYSRLGGLSSMGQASASGQAASGMQSADSISNLYGNQSAALAGGVIGRGNVVRQTFGDIMQIGKAGADAYKAFG